MVRRGIVPSREQAREAIEAGRVLVSGAPADKPARSVAAGEPIRLLGPPPRFVGRGGEKLDAALERFGIDVAGRRALDAGASTGGFTDCLLQRGVVEVVAVDVGHGQLHERLRADPRVVNRERTNIRLVESGAFGGRFPVVVADLSFISLRTVLPMLLDQADPGADLVLLVKPQFEAGKADVSRGKGVVADPEVWRRVVDDVQSACLGAGAAIMGAMVSPLRGADGNVEFLLHVVAPGSDVPAQGLDPAELDRLVASAGSPELP